METTFVRAKCFFDSSIHFGVLLAPTNYSDRVFYFKYLRFNNVIKRLDWIVGETSQFEVIKKVVNNQLILLF